MPPIINEYAPEAERIANEGKGGAEEALIRLQHRLARSGVQAESDVLNGPPVATIVEQALQDKADYIVMGSHGHGALYNLLVGGTASGVIQKAPCPVVIVPTRRAAAVKAIPELKTV
jgi:nucleotide-binding universal stress UspA family protein